MPAETYRSECSDQEFWHLISRAAFANPFSPERRELDLKITGTPTEDPKPFAAAVASRVAKLEAAGKATIKAYSGEERAVMRSVFLFGTYHQFCEDLDRLVEQQIRSEKKSCPVPFAKDLLSQLIQRGFSTAEAVRFLGIFYQLRRAYFFIVRGLIGQAPCMQDFRRRLWNNVFTHDIRLYDSYLWNRMEDFSTLLLGETGTGKGAAAAAIGRSGFIPFDEHAGTFVESFTDTFVSLNLSQFPESLIESELFGHKKGAFTGAIQAHPGVFARCSPHGAIFLDEIGDVSVPAQIKLLQVLQERTFSPVGSHERLRFHGRVIAATNKPLHELRRRKLFRDDFFYRLCSDVIVVPPLRQRIEESESELDLLLGHIVGRLTQSPAPELASLLREKIIAGVGQHYRWPGNVRELEQAARRVLLTEVFQGDHPPATDDLRDELVNGIEAGHWDADAVLAGYCALLHQRHGTLEEVARRTRLDRRTVKKYIQQRTGTQCSPKQ